MRAAPILVALALLAGASPVDAARRPRIVSLAPNVTELAYAAGAGDLLVGAVEYSDYPDAARRLPRVGDAWRVDPERVLALEPDLVLAWSSGTPEDTIARLRALGLRVEAIPVFRLADVGTALRTIGGIAGTGAVAGRAAAEFDAEIARLRRDYAGARTLSVFIEIDDEPLYTVNGRHVISEVVELCGGRNVFADIPQLAPPVGVEAVLARDPQVILSTDDTIADPTALWSRWTRLAAVRDRTIYSMPSDTLGRATPRLAQGAAAVCAALDDARRRVGAR
ncbi:MAG: cobalamin-binding protein [Steroidobacteraceae bacterium]